MDFTSTAVWAALGSILLANLVLAGDNAVVIALAAHTLPVRQQRRAIVLGSSVAIGVRVVLTVLLSEVLRWPYLKLAGAAMLILAGVSMMAPETAADDGAGGHGSMGLSGVHASVLASLSLGLDNMLAIAAAAQDDPALVAVGLALSILVIGCGSAPMLHVLERFPVVITLGAALLGYLSGELLVTDPAWFGHVGEPSGQMSNWAGALGAALVVGVGLWRQRDSTRSTDR